MTIGKILPYAASLGLLMGCAYTRPADFRRADSFYEEASQMTLAEDELGQRLLFNKRTNEYWLGKVRNYSIRDDKGNPTESDITGFQLLSPTKVYQTDFNMDGLLDYVVVTPRNIMIEIEEERDADMLVWLRQRDNKPWVQGIYFLKEETYGKLESKVEE